AYGLGQAASYHKYGSLSDLQIPPLLSEVQFQKALPFSPEQASEKTSRYERLSRNGNALSGYLLHKSCRSDAEHLLPPASVHQYWQNHPNLYYRHDYQNQIQGNCMSHQAALDRRRSRLSSLLSPPANAP